MSASYTITSSKHNVSFDHVKLDRHVGRDGKSTYYIAYVGNQHIGVLIAEGDRYYVAVKGTRTSNHQDIQEALGCMVGAFLDTLTGEGE